MTQALRQAAQQALAYILSTAEHDQLCDALDLDDEGRHKPCSCLLQDVLDDLRTALAEPAEQEPVAEVAEAAQAYDGKWTAIVVTGDVELQSGDKLYTAPQPAIPPGYKLVPVEPTDEMLRAVCNCNDIDHQEQIADDYRAMLAAAPQHKAEPEPAAVKAAWLAGYTEGQKVAWAEQPSEQKPVAHENSNGVVHAAGYPWSDKEVLRPLVYGDTAPQPAKREPLTDAEIQDLLKVGNPTEDEYRLIRMGWNAAHGIKE